jgi:two-component sensor histidine kinase
MYSGGFLPMRVVESLAASPTHAGRGQGIDLPELNAEQRRHLERQQNLLLDEINHRVRNTLATVQAIAMQTLKDADAPARDAFLARLFALSGQHDLLALNNWDGASLEGVVRRALQDFRDRGRIVIDGPPVHLSSKRALALGMALHELATNAARHGALSLPEGRLQVRWVLGDDGTGLRLTWRESGGPPVAPPASQGFGLRLIEQGLAHETGSHVELRFAPEGLTCSWDMKLA